jgi:predicted ATPase
MIECEDHSTGPFITSVEVDGLHNRLSFKVYLQSGVNIIYGKNGIGKTTLLHIIANLSEVDIDRFANLSFKTIRLTNSENDSVRLEKADRSIFVYLNDQLTSYISGSVGLSEAERNGIRAVVGERATYLPAFRSVLERMRELPYGNYEERAKPEFEALQRTEQEAYRSARRVERSVRRDGSSVDSNVSKTIRCRQWFGSFVPIVRYPSITDVVSGLSEEWSNAQISISRVERKQFETAFIEIFSAIAKGDISGGDQDQHILLEEIKDLVSIDETTSYGPGNNSTYSQLVNIADDNRGSEQNYSNILEIYRNKLLARKNERNTVLGPINAFQESVNVFLTEKAFKVGTRAGYPIQRTRDSSVFIEPDVGKPYSVTALSSGERQILTMLYSASRSPFTAGCCLIDEPELSLHVDWQRIILRHIEKQHRGRQIIACTHSPEVGADHENRVQFFSPQTVESADEEADLDEGVGL